jgi:hypothetical protein
MSGSIEMPGNISIVFLPIVFDFTTPEGNIPSGAAIRLPD